MLCAPHGVVWMPLCAALIALPVWADELKPYSLPSQQLQQRIEPRLEQRIVVPTISEEFYQNYAIQVRSLDAAQRQQLLASIEQSFVQAFQAGRMEEARHYRRLIHIVQMAPEHP